MQSSVARMAGLIDNVLDLARGRLGGGLTLQRAAVQLGPVLNLVIEELRASHPTQQVEAVMDLDTEVDCDRGRIAQLLSNLLGNALTHGAAEQPVMVHAGTRSDVFELSVSNAGEEIPARCDRTPVPALRLRGGPPGPGGARPRPLYRLGNRPGAWRFAERRVIADADAFHLHHAPDGNG